MRDYMNGRVTPPPGVPHLHVSMTQINLIFANFFSFPENIKTPFELSLIQFTRFSDESNVLKFIIFRRYLFLPPLK